MKSITIDSPAALTTVAKNLLAYAEGCRFFVFEGEMAAGKTTFIKALCAELGVPDLVSSPTFSIVNEYASPAGLIYHFDFYRLKNLQEAFDIGYEEYFYSDGICLVEWPQKIAGLLPENYIAIKIDIKGETGRVFSFSKVSNR
jgi:tRNA threonylcarbamoyladenosine biosynthesis protein TsaE